MSIIQVLAGIGQPVDPYYEYTTLLLPGSGTNGAQNNTFLDGSTNNFTITRNGNTTQGTFSPFSQTGWGNYFDGTGDSLNTTSSSAFNFSTGSFTLECWFNKQGAGGSADAVGNVLIYTGSGSNNATWLGVTDSGTLIGKIGFSGSWATEISGGSVSNGVWNHVALVRNGTAVNLYLNGASIASASNSTDLSTFGTNASIAVNYLSTRTFNGYISNARIVNGVAVYTGAFTPPTSPLAATQSAGTNISAITGTQTSLLTCQSNRFIDNSTNNFTITRNGDTRVVAFSPFNPTASWSAATYGGSGYFDGNGDTLTAPSGASISGTGDFTVETWIYPTSIPSTYSVMVAGDTSGSLAAFILNGTTGLSGAPSGSISFGRTLIAPEGNTSNTINWNAWNHLLISRVSGTLKLFINGVQGYSAANSTNYASSVIRIGSDGGGTNNLYVGYMCGTKYVQGTGVTSVTVPTTPPTATSGTSLLLNFTNAGIYDATSKNDLETVGNAQISTAISAKWGSGSMYFDGTGDYLNTLSTWAISGSEAYTLEAWIYPTTVSGDLCIYETRSSSGTGFVLFINSTGKLQVYDSTGLLQTASTTTLTANTWTYIALVRSAGSSTNTYYVNGTSAGTFTLASFAAATNSRIGARNDGIAAYNGYMQDFRITKGYARTITASPTAAFPTL